MISFSQLATKEDRLRFELENYKNALLRIVDIYAHEGGPTHMVEVARAALNGVSFSPPEPESE